MSSILVKKISSTECGSLKPIFKSPGRIYTFLNPVSYLDARKEKDLFSGFDGIFADGSLLALSIRLFYFKKVKRYSFDMTSVAPELFAFAEQNGKSVYIVASKQTEVEKAVEVFKGKYPNVKIAGYRNGYFSSAEEVNAETENIARIAPDFLIVGMGIKAQERFLTKAKEQGFKGIGFTCGGFVHQTAEGKIDYYPKWVDRFNVRFLYRIAKEKHTRKRYLKAAFVFPVKFLIDRF